MNRRHLFQLLGGAFAAAALELGMMKPIVGRVEFMGQWLEVGPRYDWVTGTGWVQHAGGSNAWEPNPNYVDSEESS